jgi:hypothetical protein
MYETPRPNPVLHYMAILKAGKDFGLTTGELEAVVNRFDHHGLRCDELAEAVADAVLCRASLDSLFASFGEPA